MESQCFNDELASSTVVWVFLRIYVRRGSVPAAEAKKADDASMDTRRSPDLLMSYYYYYYYYKIGSA